MVALPQLRIGPAGWSYEDWNGIVYPAHRPRGFHEAEFLAGYFDTIEINTSFYRPLRPELSKLWARKVAHNPNFLFTAKLWQRFTHERLATHADEVTFKQGLDALAVEGKLGALLLQFPWSFKNVRENREYLAGLLMLFHEYPLVVEVRHASWNDPAVFEMLVENSVGFCNIDQPVIGRSLQPTAEITAPLGYVRLHGRNYEAWFSDPVRRDDAQPHDRYNYLYSMAELEPWAERINRIASGTRMTFVITNNHYQGKAVANALQLITLLRGTRVKAPETLLAHFPELEDIASAEPAESGLFPPARKN